MGCNLPDVAVVGLGPAGRALAHRCLARGLDVVAIDPHPDRSWTPTYAAWDDELPAWLPDVARTHVAAPAAYTTHRHEILRGYQVFDNDTLRAALDIGTARVVAGTAGRVGTETVELARGESIRARTVVDARGAADLTRQAEQTAFGLVVDADVAAPAMDDAPAWFMDWRLDNGCRADAQPTFLYAMPLGDDRVLLEETCLVGRPGLDQRSLRVRLEARLHRRGVTLTGHEPVERVRFPVESSRRTGTFGARGGLVHPGTGYSVAASLAAADAAATAIADGSSLDGALWSARARAADRLRRVGMNALLSLPPELMATFFAEFFDLPAVDQRAYLSERTDPAGTVRAMWALLVASPPGIRAVLLRAPFARQIESIRT